MLSLQTQALIAFPTLLLHRVRINRPAITWEIMSDKGDNDRGRCTLLLSLVSLLEWVTTVDGVIYLGNSERVGLNPRGHQGIGRNF